MRYYLDFEFIEGLTYPRFCGLKLPSWLRKPIWKLQPVSVGIVCEDGREFYALFNDFDYRDADEWVVGNVLKPLADEKYLEFNRVAHQIGCDVKITHKNLHRFGKKREDIAYDIKQFVTYGLKQIDLGVYEEPEFWGYYADYDWVCLASTFGTMLGMSQQLHGVMHCNDLKQSLSAFSKTEIKELKGLVDYKIRNSAYSPLKKHNALDDARWNKMLHEVLLSLP